MEGKWGMESANLVCNSVPFSDGPCRPGFMAETHLFTSWSKEDALQLCRIMRVSDKHEWKPSKMLISILSSLRIIPSTYLTINIRSPNKYKNKYKTVKPNQGAQTSGKDCRKPERGHRSIGRDGKLIKNEVKRRWREWQAGLVQGRLLKWCWGVRHYLGQSFPGWNKMSPDQSVLSEWKNHP